MNRKMPEVRPPAKMEAALDVLVDASSNISTPDEYHGTTTIYLDEHRSIAYKSRWHLKTQKGALDRQKRETIQFLNALRAQIDDVLSKFDSRVADEHGMIAVESFAYIPRNREGET
jgi:hypothetical protein